MFIRQLIMTLLHRISIYAKMRFPKLLSPIALREEEKGLTVLHGRKKKKVNHFGTMSRVNPPTKSSSVFRFQKQHISKGLLHQTKDVHPATVLPYMLHR